MVFLLYQQNLPNNNFFKFFYFCFWIVLKIKIYVCATCKGDSKITNSECFNNINFFTDKKYMGGNFAENKNKDMIIEYSCEGSRLFYGLKNNGKNFFGESPIKRIETMASDENNNNRYESENIFISLEDDTNKNTQYLFSTSTGSTIIELHDLNTGEYKVKNTNNYFGTEIFSYKYVLFEKQINHKNIYFIIFIHNGGQSFYLKKFSFPTFSSEPHILKSSSSIDNSGYNKIISSFIILKNKKLVMSMIVKNIILIAMTLN